MSSIRIVGLGLLSMGVRADLAGPAAARPMFVVILIVKLRVLGVAYNSVLL